jgi:glycosyltransferase involved in cell wall biosynthesis
MHVLIVHPFLLHGGAETAVVKLCEYLNSQEVDHTLITLAAEEDYLNNPNLNIKVNRESIDKTQIRKSESTKKALSLIPDALILRKLVSKHKNNCDLINPHNIPAAWASIKQDKPVVWMMNEPPGIYVNEAPSQLLSGLINVGTTTDKLLIKKYVNQICVNSALTYKQAKKRYGQEPVKVLFGIDYDTYIKGNPKKIIEKYALKDNFVVITIGWLSPQKNQFASIIAIEKIREKIPEIKLIIAGRGENSYERLLKNYVHSKKLENHVVFTGYISEEEKRDLYHACHLGLYPFKGQGGLLVPFETLCASKPVIVSPTFGSSDLITQNGLPVTQNYAEVLHEVYSKYNYYQKIASEAKKFVQTELSWPKYGERLLTVFRKVAS